MSGKNIVRDGFVQLPSILTRFKTGRMLKRSEPEAEPEPDSSQCPKDSGHQVCSKSFGCTKPGILKRKKRKYDELIPKMFLNDLFIDWQPLIPGTMHLHSYSNWAISNTKAIIKARWAALSVNTAMSSYAWSLEHISHDSVYKQSGCYKTQSTSLMLQDWLLSERFFCRYQIELDL